MATFSDTRPLQYGEFVQTMPYQEANQLGMYKQQLYDQNIQKIYSGIEQTAALPLSSDVDKQYLQESLNNLQTSLKKLNTADFSRNQVVNSVAGMTSKIAKDKYIQAGVRSTMFIQSETERRKALEKEGKTDADNDMWFYDNVNKYTQRQQLAENDGSPISFNMEYTPYTDIFKLGNELLKQAGENHLTTEELFITERDENGKVVPKMFYENRRNPTTGQIERIKTGYKYADVKTIEKLTTNKDAVIGALNTLMNRGDVKKQLQISGYATYKGVPAEALAAPMKKTYTDRAKIIEDKQLETTVLLGAQNLTPEKKAELLEKNKQLDAEAKKNNSDLNQLEYEIVNKPEEFKQNLYIMQFKNNFLNIYDKEKIERTTGKNEGKEQENFVEQMNFNRLKEKNDVDYRNQTLNISRANLALSQIESAAKYGQDEYGNWYQKPSPNGAGGAGGSGTRGGKRIPVKGDKDLVPGNNPGAELSPISMIEKDISLVGQNRYQVGLEIYKRMMKMKHPEITDEEIVKNIEYRASQNKEPIEQYVIRQASYLDNNYTVNGLKPDQPMLDLAENLRAVNKKYTDKVNQYEKLKQDAAKEVGFNEADIAKLGDIETSIVKQGVDINTAMFDPNQKKYFEKLTPKDQLLIYQYYNANGKIGATGAEKQLASDAETALNDRFGSDWKSKLNFAGVGPFKSPVAKVMERLNNKKTKNYYTTLGKKLEVITGAQDTKTLELTPTDADEREVKSMMSNYINSVRTPGTIGEPYSAEEFTKFMNSKNSQINLIANKPVNEYEDWTGEVVVTNSEGKKMSVKVDKDFMQKISKNTFKSYGETAQPIEDAIQVYKTGSTNSKTLTTDPNAWKSSYFKTYEANPDLYEKGIYYHADVVKGNKGYYLANYVKLPGMTEFKTFYGKPYPTEQGATMDFKTATSASLTSDLTIRGLIKK